MVRSMTGYGRAKEILNGREITVEIRSVNSRYFEYNSRVPRNCNFLDEALKKVVSSRVERGKVELYLSMQALEQGGMEVKANHKLAGEYYSALCEISHELRIDNDITASSMMRFGDIFTLMQSETDEDQLMADVIEVAQSAVNNLCAMRQAEGEKLAADVNNRLDNLGKMLAEVEADSKGRVERYTARLHEKLKEVLQDNNIDEARILTEAAIFADKTAVDEETVRLHSHLKQYHEIITQGGSVGRKLDFLTQELNRETNTIGSKCQEVEITRLVVDMKSEIEKIREQIQNLE